MDLEKMKKQVNLLDYIQDSGAQVEKAGKEYRLNPCPVCGHKDHFTIYPDSNSYSSFSGCCKGGSIIDYMIEVEGLDKGQAIDKVKALITGAKTEKNQGKAPLITEEKQKKDSLLTGAKQGNDNLRAGTIQAEGPVANNGKTTDPEEIRQLTEQAQGGVASYYKDRGLTDKDYKAL